MQPANHFVPFSAIWPASDGACADVSAPCRRFVLGALSAHFSPATTSRNAHTGPTLSAHPFRRYRSEECLCGGRVSDGPRESPGAMAVTLFCFRRCRLPGGNHPLITTHIESILCEEDLAHVIVESPEFEKSGGSLFGMKAFLP